MNDKDFENLLDKSIAALKQNTQNITASDEVNEKTLKLLAAADRRPNILFNDFLKSKNFKTFAAASILLIAMMGFHAIVSNFDATTLAWSEVKNNFEQIDFLHYYHFEIKNNGSQKYSEGWYINGKIYGKDDTQNLVTVDDGVTRITYDYDGNTVKTEKTGIENPASFKESFSIFGKITKGLLRYNDDEILNQIPSYAGKDFLIYRFDAPKNMNEWIESVNITVGKNSKLPVQMKIYQKKSNDDYRLYIFDYEQIEIPEYLKKVARIN
jgi:hypothetical protein